MRKTRSGRPGLADPEYRANRQALLAYTDRCALCGHHGARTADHIISHKQWPRDLYGRPMPGFNHISNLQPAHGTMGNKLINRCPICGKLCNQARGSKPLHARRSARWTTSESDPDSPSDPDSSSGPETPSSSPPPATT